jgi:hypothetical protein
MRYPFQASLEELQGNIGEFVAAIFDSLESEFLMMPKGEGFVEYATFEQAYEALKRGTDGFARLDPGTVLSVVKAAPVSLCASCGPCWGSPRPNGPMLPPSMPAWHLLKAL